VCLAALNAARSDPLRAFVHHPRKILGDTGKQPAEALAHGKSKRAAGSPAALLVEVDD
jgi:hypothetical protein